MRIISAALAALLLASCATAAKMTLNDRFRAIGLSDGMSDCMVDELDDRLDDRDLQDLARFTVGLSRADTPMEAVESLLRIDNPRAVAAIGASAFSCIAGFTR